MNKLNINPPLEFFTEDDGIYFASLQDTFISVKKANEMLNAKLGPKLVGFHDREGYLFGEWHDNGDDLTCYAFLIEPLKKECAHERPISVLDKMLTSTTLSPGKVGFSYFQSWECADCGKKLKAEWKAEE